MEMILELKHISKQFPGVLANDDVSLAIGKGEVFTLLGENGAGKSTLMNMICGLYQPSGGEIFLEGKRVRFSSARDAMRMGIGMVHQHFMLVPCFSVVENCLIGVKAEGLCMDVRKAAEQIRKLGEQYNLNIDPNAMVEDLSVGERQRVEIIKALLRGARILILDEPTAVLTPQETEELFRMVRNLKDSGFTVIFISHKLNEVMEISDRIGVLRLGRLTGIYEKSECDPASLARLMVNREVNFSVEREEHPFVEPVLQVRDLTLARTGGGAPILDHISFDLREGEILGIAGVDGNGQSEMVECLTGLMKATGGSAMYEGKNLLEMKTRSIMNQGVSHIPQDRQKSGLVMTMNITENMIMQDYYTPGFGKGPFVDWAFAERYSNDLIRDFSVKTPSRFELVQNLSGGNQQKVIVARELARKPRLLIAMHPTRGLDVGAIEYIHAQIMKQRDQGVAVLLISTELDEVMKLSDAVAVLYEGRIMGRVKPAEVTVEEVGLMMGGAPREQE